ncbi:phage baseplate upper protein [Clostridium estertheticum]|uniref:BppU family phage baseplate upper protein n=1 Tax=Clostridium estertheticum TaxID=238834 RepID=UPI0013EE3F87|nr:BppU family phage baseplate upper protein [Clostridium estertheticum]MBZ9608625.1 phage baseplate upper protein [Clostridium estertheticum]
MENRYIVRYDLKSKILSNIRFKQGDTGTCVLEMNLTNNGKVVDITGQNIEFKFLRNDKNIVIQDFSKGVVILDPLKGIFECTLESAALAIAGLVKCEISFSEGNNLLSTEAFTFIASPSIGALSINYISEINNKIIEWNTECKRNENDRTNLFNSNEKNRSTEFTTKETARTNLFNANEKDRSTDFGVIKKDYDKYKNVMIAESNVAELQSQINKNVGEIDELIELTTAPSYSVELNQTAKMFSIGTGKNDAGADVDVSNSVVNGIVNHSIEGNTSDMYVDGILSDFKGKTVGSMFENPNFARYSDSATSLRPPTLVGESVDYLNIGVLDGSVRQVASLVSLGAIPQMQFSFDIIKSFEKRYGAIPSETQTTSSKIAWLKANVVKAVGKWYGYGLSPSGNKAYLTFWGGSIWTMMVENTASISTRTSYGLDNIDSIDVNGFLHFLAYTDASDGITKSLVYTDYVSLEMTFKPSYKSVGENFGGKEVHKIDVLSRGKNLFDPRGILDDHYLGINPNDLGELVYTLTGNKATQNYCGVKPNTTYYLSKNGNFLRLAVFFYDDKKVCIGRGGNTDVPFTTLANCEYVRFYQTNPQWGDKLGIQLEEGKVATPYVPYVEDARTLILEKPLKRISTTADVYKEGQVTRNISDWLTLDSSLGWSPNPTTFKGFQSFYTNLPPVHTGKFASQSDFVIKYNGTLLKHLNTAWESDNSQLTTNGLNMSVSNNDSGFSDFYVPTTSEIKAYLNGWKMCHTDGFYPYLSSLVPYNPNTWAEWTKPVGIVGDSTGLEFTANGNTLGAPYDMTVKPLTKYGLLYNVVSSNLDGILNSASATRGLAFGNLPKTIGNNKIVGTSNATNLDLGAVIYTGADSTKGTKIKLKDIRIFELPTGSQIETNFNTLTADQLTEKYKFYGLNPKNWKRVINPIGVTSTLPTAPFEGYTPYKMLYKLANPITEILNIEGNNPLEPSGTLPLSCCENGTLSVDGGEISPTTKYIVPINFRATISDNNASIGEVKTYVLELDSYTTNSLLSIADRELRMKSIELLTTETTTDLKAKINEILNIWRA